MVQAPLLSAPPATTGDRGLSPHPAPEAPAESLPSQPAGLEGLLAQLDPVSRWKFEQELARANQEKIWKIGPRPAWVESLPPSTRRPTDAQMEFLETQTRLEGAASPQYIHYMYRVQNERDVRRFSNLSIPFHPGTKRPIVHTLDIHRSKTVISQRTRRNIRFVAEETMVETPERGRSATHIARSAMLQLGLEGVQVGDRVEVAYTLEITEDTRLMSRSSIALNLDMPLAVQRIRHRVIAPADAPALAMRQIGDARKPRFRNRGAWKEYVWERLDVPPHADAPGTHPSVEISNFASWDEVALLVRPMFHRGEHSPELTALAASIRAEHQEPAAQALAALRHVQGKIAYSAAAMGPWTHEPKPLAMIFQEGFADCKGKVLILLTLLAELGIPAEAVLVNMSGVDADALPSPWVMNHVIVALYIDGREIFVDPTRPNERGDLSHLSGYSFMRGLVLAPGRGLVEIPHRGDESRPHIVGTATYRVGPPGQPTELRWQADSNGSGADDARTIYRDEPVSAMQGRMSVAFGEMHDTRGDVASVKRWDDEPLNTHYTDSQIHLDDIWHVEPDGAAVSVFWPLYLVREIGALPEVMLTTPWCDEHVVTTTLDFEFAAEVIGESFAIKAPGLSLTHDITTTSPSSGATRVSVRDQLRICSYEVEDSDAMLAMIRDAPERIRVKLRIADSIR